MKINQKLLAYLDSSDNQNSEARVETAFLLLRICLQKPQVLVETLLEKLKPLVKEKSEIGDQQKSKRKISIFGSFRILMQ